MILLWLARIIWMTWMNESCRSEEDVSVETLPNESYIIALAWSDDVSFDAITDQTGLSETDVIVLMRRKLKPASFRLWRRRVSGRRSKHRAKGICAPSLPDDLI